MQRIMGRPLTGRKTIEQRLFPSIDTSGGKEECWPRHDKNGDDYESYSQIMWQGEVWLAHRVVFALMFGLVPKVVMHTCDNPPCCNPFHLRAGTHLDNVRDMVSKGRRFDNSGERHGRAKLTEKEVLAIRRSDAPRSDLAQHYQVNRTCIDKIKNGKAWKHLPNR